MNEHEHALILLSLDAELTPEEATSLELLLQRSAPARLLHQQLHRLREDIRHHGSSSFSPGFTDAVMRGIDAQRAPRLSLVRPFRTRYWMAAAACIVLLAISGLAWWSMPRTVTAPPGEQRAVVLSDGSEVELNSASSLTYRPFAFRNARLVSLEGEAFFSVSRNDRPFVVETFNARIQVLGTRFNVSTRPILLDRETRVSVEEGHVLVQSLQADETAVRRPAVSDPEGRSLARSLPVEAGVVLTAGEQTVVAADTTRPRPAAPAALDETLAWRRGGLAFPSIPLTAAVDELERRYGRPIVLHASTGDVSIHFITQTRQPLEAVLTDICTPLHLAYRLTADGYEIYRP